MATYNVYTVCGHCKTWRVFQEDDQDWESLKRSRECAFGGPLISVRCPRCCAMVPYSFDRSLVDQHPDYRFVSDEEEEQWREQERQRKTPHRKLEPDEFFCVGCRAIHRMNSAVKDKLNSGKWLRIDCSCGHKIRLAGAIGETTWG